MTDEAYAHMLRLAHLLCTGLTQSIGDTPCPGMS